MHITITDCNAKPKAPPLKELKLELTGIKHVVLTQATEKGFQLLTKEFPELKGVPVQIRIDKTFIKTLKKAFQEADSIQETLKKAIAEQDMAKLVELQQLQQTANILGYYQNNPFVFDPI